MISKKVKSRTAKALEGSPPFKAEKKSNDDPDEKVIPEVVGQDKVETSLNDLGKVTDNNLEAENITLKAKLFEMEKSLTETLEINEELKTAKALLSDEILDLTKVLFEEANGMVANEVRARTQLESSRRKIQLELDATQDRLKLESQQLNELKQKLYEVSKNNSTISLPIQVSVISEEQHVPINAPNSYFDGMNYFEIFFPDRRFCSRYKTSGNSSNDWERIIGSVDGYKFDAFAKFVEVIGTLNDESFFGNPYMRKIFEGDMLPCLSFDCKPKTFVKSILMAMLKNLSSIEKVNINSLLGSPLQSPLSASFVPSEKETLSTLSSSPVIQNEYLHTVGVETAPTPGSTSKLISFMSELTVSLSSLTEPGYTPKTGVSNDSSLKKPQPKFCALCGLPLDCPPDSHIFKFRLIENEQPMFIEKQCREKLVAVAELITFLRHLRKGLFSSRPIIDLYFELLHYRRNLFYARTGALAFFTQSDFDNLIKY